MINTPPYYISKQKRKDLNTVTITINSSDVSTSVVFKSLELGKDFVIDKNSVEIQGDTLSFKAALSEDIERCAEEELMMQVSKNRGMSINAVGLGALGGLNFSS